VIYIYSFIVFFLVCIGFIDAKTFYIPNKLLLCLLGSVILYTIFFWDSIFFVHQILGFLGGFWLFFLIYKIVGGMGYGDVKFSAVLGFTLGIYYWFFAMLFAVFSAMTVFIFLYLKKRWTAKTKIPFGPFISFGGIIMIVTRLLQI